MRRPEQSLQIAVAQYLRLALKPPTLWTAFPAGGGGKTRGAFLKAMGLQAGWPDILVIHPVSRLSSPVRALVIGIELKAAKGRPSPSQIAVAEQLENSGGQYYIARSVTDVQTIIERCGVIPLYARVLP